MPETTTATKPQQCRHIHLDGRRCGSPSLRKEVFCYQHHATRKPLPHPRRSEHDTRASFNLPMPEDRAAIQFAIGEVIRRIASNQIDSRRAGLILFGLQIASGNLPPQPRTAVPDPYAVNDLVKDVTEDPDLGLLAPEADFTEKTRPKSSMQIIVEDWEKEQAERAANPLPPLQDPTLKLYGCAETPSALHIQPSAVFTLHPPSRPTPKPANSLRWAACNPCNTPPRMQLQESCSKTLPQRKSYKEVHRRSWLY